MSDDSHYSIRGGLPGRERLRVLARVLRPSTEALFDRLGIGAGMACLDVGCGGGDVTLELARRVSPTGQVVGTDIDAAKLEIARREAEQAGVRNVEYRLADARDAPPGEEFDLVHARFLLSHLSDPEAAVAAFARHARRGGFIAVQDVDFAGHFTWPESDAFTRYYELYRAVVWKRGGDAEIGRRLAPLLVEGGLHEVDMHIVQPAGLCGESKVISALTMEAVADAVLSDGLATREEIAAITKALFDFAEDPRTVAGLPRVVQAWGRRP